MAYHHGDLKNALIEAAIPLLAEHGIAGLSLREVARVVGVGHAAPYRHFRNKQELLQAIAIYGFGKLEKNCVLAEKKYPNNPVQQFADVGRRYVLFVYDNPEISNLMSGGYFSNETCGEEMMAAANQAMSGMVRIAQRGQDTGFFKKIAIEQLALSAWSMMHGLSMLIISGMLYESATSRKKVIELSEAVGQVMFQGILK